MEINGNEDGSENVEDSISSDNSYDTKNENILFDIDVKLGNNKTAKLYISENDDINEKIKYFCEAYKIKPELEPKIKTLVENRLNQELSAYKNSSTASSSKQIINNKEKKENREFLPVQDRLLEQIENESEIISEHENTIKNSKNSNNNFINDKNIMKVNNKNEINKNSNLNAKKIKSKNNANVKNPTKLKNNKDYISTNIIKTKNNTNKNKDFNKAKKINAIKLNNKSLIKKRPNSNTNKIINKGYSNFRVNTTINSTPKKKIFVLSNYIEKDKIHKFSPEINKNSEKIFKKNYYLINNQKVEDRLISYGNKLNQKILNEKTNILLNNIKENSFSPKIDNHSRHIAENFKKERINKLSSIGDYTTNISSKNKINNKKNKIKIMNLNNIFEKRNLSQGNKSPNNLIKTFVSFGENNNIFNNENQSNILTEKSGSSLYHPDKNIFDCLYLESKLDRINKEKEINRQFKDKYTFRPTISNLAKELKREKNETKKEFIERMSSLDKKNKINKKENLNYNFRPKITRGPKNIKQREIDENLKGYYDKRIIKPKEDLQNNERINNKEKKKYYLKKSSEIIMKMKGEKYKSLFERMDSDKDGLISYDKIKLTGISNDILEDIRPILRELNESKQAMNFQTFCNKVHNLLIDKNGNIK